MKIKKLKLIPTIGLSNHQGKHKVLEINKVKGKPVKLNPESFSSQEIDCLLQSPGLNYSQESLFQIQWHLVLIQSNSENCGHQRQPLLEKTAAGAKIAEVVVGAADADTSGDAPVAVAVVVAVQFVITLLGSKALIFDASVEVKLIISA